MVDDISKAIEGSGSESLTTADAAASKVEMRPLRDDEPSDEILRNAKNGHVRGDAFPHIELTNEEGFKGDVIFTMPYSLDNLKLYVEPFGKGIRGDAFVEFRNNERRGVIVEPSRTSAAGRYTPRQISKLRGEYRKDVDDIFGLDRSKRTQILKRIRDANIEDDDVRAVLSREIDDLKSSASSSAGGPILPVRPVATDALTSDQVESFRSANREELEKLRSEFIRKNISNTEISRLITENEEKIQRADSNAAFSEIVRDQTKIGRLINSITADDRTSDEARKLRDRIKRRYRKGGAAKKDLLRDGLDLTDEERAIVLKEADKRKKREALVRNREMAKEYGETKEDFEKLRMAREYGAASEEESQMLQYESDEAERAQGERFEQEELVRWNNRSLPQKFFDWLQRKQPPRPRYAPEVLALLSDRNRTAEERKLIQMVVQATEKHNGIRMREAADRGVAGPFARTREIFKGGGKAVAIATAITTFVAIGLSGGSLAVMPLIAAKVIGAGVGALASTAAKNHIEKIGRTDKISKYVVPLLIGSIAGVGTGLAAGHAIEAMSSYFSSPVPEAPTPPQGAGQGAGQGGANAISPTGRSGVLASSLVPAAPHGFDLGDYGYLGNKVILEQGSNIWSQITSGLCDQGLLDPKGRAAFADAFYRTVEDGGFKDLFLSYNNRPLGSGVFWNNLPVGTVGHYDRLLSNPKFVDMLVDRIGDNYPSLLQKINSGGFSAFDFIRGVAYSHGAKV